MYYILISHTQAVFGDDEEQDAKGLSSASSAAPAKGEGGSGGGGAGSVGSAEEVDDGNLQPDTATAAGGSDVGEY